VRKARDQLFQARKTKAEALEKSERLFEAYYEYDSIERDFSGLMAIEGVSTKAKMLEDNKAVKYRFNDLLQKLRDTLINWPLNSPSSIFFRLSFRSFDRSDEISGFCRTLVVGEHSTRRRLR
jgi:hypothetical protein